MKLQKMTVSVCLRVPCAASVPAKSAQNASLALTDWSIMCVMSSIVVISLKLIRKPSCHTIPSPVTLPLPTSPSYHSTQPTTWISLPTHHSANLTPHTVNISFSWLHNSTIQYDVYSILFLETNSIWEFHAWHPHCFPIIYPLHSSISHTIIPRPL